MLPKLEFTAILLTHALYVKHRIYTVDTYLSPVINKLRGKEVECCND